MSGDQEEGVRLPESMAWKLPDEWRKKSVAFAAANGA